MTVLWSAFFATGNWLFFTRRFMSNQQIGIFDAVCFLFGLLVEIPSGAVADRWGRRKTMIVASILMGLGYGGMGLSMTSWHIYAGYLAFTLGYSLFSGADDALMYDYMKHHGIEDKWQKLQREKTITRRIGNVVATLLGAPLYAISSRLPSLARGVFFLLMLIPLSKMKFLDTEHIRERTEVGYLSHLHKGFKTMFNARLLPLVIMIIFIGGIGNTFFIGGVLRPFMLERAGLDVAFHPVVIAVAGLISILLLLKQPHVKTNNLYITSVAVSILMILGFAVNIPLSSTVLMIVGIIVIHIANYLLQPLISELVNNEATSEHRATTISTANLFDQLGYVIAAPLIGIMVSRNNLGTFVAILVTCMSLALMTSYALHRSSQQLAKKQKTSP